MSEVLVIDVESTCWEPASTQPRGEINEIIEIGVSNVDLKTLTITANESILVKPQRSRLSSFCTKLTTLTPEIVNKGVYFQDACELLRHNFKSYNKTMVSWGDYDRSMFERNCRDYNCQYPFGKRHLNLKNCFTLLYGLEREPGMDAALQLLKLPLDGTHHRGVDDAKNIAKIFIHTLKKFRG
jgi:inhibitor of KinA sporulation pathway (predicted exonuclease)